MNGKFAASGLEYQKETFLFLIFKYLTEKTLRDAKYEFEIDGIEVDFSICIESEEDGPEGISDKKQKVLCEIIYEVKKGDNICNKATLIKSLKKFCRIYEYFIKNNDNVSNKRFCLVHSSLPKNELGNLWNLKDNPMKRKKWFEKNVCPYGSENCLFADKVELLFLPRNSLGSKLKKIDYTDIALRTIAQIKNILKTIEITKNTDKKANIDEEASDIYLDLMNRIEMEVERISEDREKIQKNTISKNVYNNSNNLIKLNKLVYDSKLIDWYHKYKILQSTMKDFEELDREKAFKEFCKEFQMDLQIPQ